LPAYLAKDAIGDGRLQPVLSDFAVDRGDLWLVWPPGRIDNPRVRVFADFLTKLIAPI
jgi:DNA-binding transcriptional LysR family regulator